MPQQTFEITAPNGQTLEISGDRVPTEAELQEIFAKAGVSIAVKPDTRPLLRSRTGTLYQAPADAGPLGTFASHFASGINPVNLIRGGVNLATTAVTDPAAAGRMVVEGLMTPVREAREGDFAAAAGDVAAAAALGKGISAAPAMAMKALPTAGRMTAVAADLAPDAIGMMSPRMAHAVRFGQKIRAAIAKTAAEQPAATTPTQVTVNPAAPAAISQMPRLTLAEFKLAQELVRTGFTNDAALTTVRLLRDGLTPEQAVDYLTRKGGTP